MITAQELIDKLSQYPPNTPVLIELYEEQGTVDIDCVTDRTVEYKEDWLGPTLSTEFSIIIMKV